MFKELLDWYMAALETGGYPMIVLMMAVESSLLPLPSELVIPPAAMLVQKGTFSIPGIILAGTVGSWIGATVMYWLSRWGGRPLALKYGRYFLISAEKIQAAERWSKKFGSFGVFVSRLLPVVRHLIGIPMGIVKMDFRWYSLFTLLGSAIWCSVLCWVGIKAGNDPKLMQGDLHQILFWMMGALGVLGLLYYFAVHRPMRKTR
ncbi:MAG: DedA family protein [Verrucomicrobiota bacterium]